MSNTSPYVPVLQPRAARYALVDLRNGRSFALQAGPNSIGRSPKNRVVLDDFAVSRRHAVVMVHDDGKCEVGDAESRNGVYLNGHRVLTHERLAPADLLQIDGFRLLFTRQGADDDAPAAFEDGTLGVVVWDAPDACWHFGITLGVNRFAPATYSPPPDGTPPSASPEWEAVRDLARQVRARECEARELVLREFGSEDGEPMDLTRVTLTSATATYAYAGPGTGSLCVSIDRAGEFVSGPTHVPGEPADV